VRGGVAEKRVEQVGLNEEYQRTLRFMENRRRKVGPKLGEGA